MEKLKEEFLNYLDFEKNQIKKEVELLESDNRKDETKFLKAKANIYDIFKTMYQVAEKQSAGDMDKLRRNFLDKVETIPLNWKNSYELAQKHQDIEKILVEEAKLHALNNIAEKFHSIY